jgi:hypothetical protein
MRIVVPLLLAASATAHADVTVTRTRVPPPFLLDLTVTGGERVIGTESAGGLALGAEIGRRLHPHWGAVAVLEADGMGRTGYISYGVYTIGAGVRFDARIVVTVGAGLALGSAKQFTSDLSVMDESTSGVTAFAHALLPVATIGHARLAIAGNASVKAVDTVITTVSAGAGVVW